MNIYNKPPPPRTPHPPRLPLPGIDGVEWEGMECSGMASAPAPASAPARVRWVGWLVFVVCVVLPLIVICDFVFP